jgi:hypothetical protein
MELEIYYVPLLYEINKDNDGACVCTQSLINH